MRRKGRVMNAEYQDLQTLLEVQRIDLMTMQLKKQRVELPQRIQVMRLRKKRDQIQEKLDQVMVLHKKADAELTMFDDEDSMLAEKQERAQELIDAAGSDYRKVESHSKEMASIAKRRESLAFKRVAADEQMAKIMDVRGQLEDAIAASQAEEARLRQAFEADDNALIEQIKSLSAQRSDLVAGLPADLMALYEKTAAKTGGVALGKLEDATCGVCRAAIDGGRLISLRASAPLGTCPNCKRLLVIESE